MKTRIANWIGAASVLLTGIAPVGAHGGAQDSAAHGGAQGSSAQGSEYRVTNLPSLGGKLSRGNSINDRGWVAGYSNLPGNQSRHATWWRGSSAFDLGTLGGPNSSVVWPVKNNRSVLAGISQTAAPDPLGENWSCSAFFPAATATGHICLGFIWEKGVMRPLPTLGGNNGFATGANDRGQVVGWAENTVHDPTCAPPQVLQFRAVVWGPEKNRVAELPPLSGDTSGAATALNDSGQIVGISGTCDQAVGRFTAAHAVLWEDGRVRDLGNLGGNAWNTPMAINQRGDIVGFAGQPGDDPDNPQLRAFLWTRRGGIQNLGTLPGDVYSEAHGINEQGEVVGVSCDAAGSCRAFLWQHGVMRDLNALVAPGYTGTLTTAQDIDDRGVITGRSFEPATGESPAFSATPIR